MNIFVHANDHFEPGFQRLIAMLRAAGVSMFFGFAYDCRRPGGCCELTCAEENLVPPGAAAILSPPHDSLREHMHRDLLRDLLRRCDAFLAVQTDEPSRFMAGSANTPSCEVARDLHDGGGPRIVIAGVVPRESRIGIELAAVGVRVPNRLAEVVACVLRCGREQ